MAMLSKVIAPAVGGHTSQPVHLDMDGYTIQPVTRLRYTFIQLQALVTVVLSYQLLFSRNVSLSQEVQSISILGLLLLCGSLMFLPTRLICSDWIPGALAILDTGITSVLIYISGNASSDLYLAYFVIILIVTASRTAMQMTVFLSMVTAIYGWALYREIEDTGVVLEHHLIRIPLLLIMAIFYRRTADSLSLLTYYDPVTGLPNRRQLVRLMAQRLGAGRLAGDQKVLLLVGLDGFKLINDSLGLVAGDQLLRAVATRLMECLQTTDTVARLGADEFSVLLQTAASPDVARRFAQRILDAMTRRFLLAGQEVFVSASIGIAISSPESRDADSLIRNADAAMYRAKERGKNTYE